MNRKFIIMSTLAIVISTMLGTVWASSTLYPIQASFNTNYKYSLDGKEILKDVPAIIYNNMAYVPIFNIAKDLGYTATVTDDQAILTSPTDVPIIPTTLSTPADSVTIDRAQIIAIDVANNMVTVVPAGKSNHLENQIRLVVTPETKIQDFCHKKSYKLSELQPGINVKVVHSAVSTKSIPPQTVAYSITIL